MGSLAPPDFEELSESTVLSIVIEEAMNISELELFDATKRWAGYHLPMRSERLGDKRNQHALGIIFNLLKTKNQKFFKC